jgi:hypothetical protein
MSMAQQYGFVTAARALLGKPVVEKEEVVVVTMPSPGTTASARRQQLDIMSFMDVRTLGTQVYKGPDGNFILSVNEVLAGHNRDEIKQRVLDFEIANGLVVQDAPNTQQPTQPQGAPPMAQPFPTPPGAPPQQMPPQYQPPQPPQFQPQPGGYMPQPGGYAPQQMPPAPPPPPIASPTQAAQAAAPQEAPQEGGKKRGRGPNKAAAGAAAPPPPPPPAAPPQQQYAPPPQQQAYPPQQFAGPPPQYQPPQGPPQQFAVPAPFQQPQMGGAPPQYQPPAQQAPAPVPQQQAPAAAPQIDIGPLLAEVRAVGQAINSSAQGTNAQIAELKVALATQTVALMHIYGAQAQLGQWLAGQNKGDVLMDPKKFVEFLSQFLPK